MISALSPQIAPEGDCAVRVQFGDRIEPAINRRVHDFCHAVAKKAIVGVLECVPSYCVATVYYRPEIVGYDTLLKQLSTLLPNSTAPPHTETPLIEIPVVYGGEFGPDLADIARRLSLTEDEVVARHSKHAYLCYMIGFMPGFPYLGELPGDLRLPRRESPRVRVPAGSVALADAQTGIYPQESPGGWHLIGRTPLRLFNPVADPPTIIQPGDFVQFVPIEVSQFHAADDDARQGKHSMRRTSHES